MDAALKAIIQKINRKLGDGTILLGSEIAREVVPRCSSGSLSLDIALGGGWPGNQWSEIVGYESAGKTLIALKTIAANQARDPKWTAVWFDAEQCWDRRWARQLGVDDDRVIVMSDNGMESVYQATIEFLSTRKVDCIVIDSLPALVPEREDENEMGELAVGLGALLTGQFFRKQRSATRRSLTVEERPVFGLVINQWRDRIGVIHGDPKTTPGGRGKNYSFVVRVEVKRDQWLEEGEFRVGHTIKAHCIKNKTAPPQRTAIFDFYFVDSGPFQAGQFDVAKEIVALGLKYQAIERAGAYYSYGDQRWQGKERVLEALRDEAELLAELEAEVMRLAFKKPAGEGVVQRSVRKKK